MDNNKNSISIPHLILLSLIGLTVINLGVIFFLPESDSKTYLSDIVFVLLNLVTVFSLWSAAWHFKKTSGIITKGWVVLGLAQLIFAIGDLIWAYYEIIVKSNPFPSLADIFYLAYYPVFLIGIILLNREVESKIQKIKYWLDAGIVFISIGLFFGQYILFPLIGSFSDKTILVQILDLAYPLGDLVLLSALLILIYGRQNEKLENPILFIAISIFIQIATDTIFTHQSLINEYISGGWLDSGWILGYCLLGIAGYLQSTERLTTQKVTRNQNLRNVKWKKALTIILDYLPYSLIILTYLYIIVFFGSEKLAYPNFTLDSVGILILLVIIRQFLSIRENSQLNVNINNAFEDIRIRTINVQKVNNELILEIDERKKIEIQLAFNSLHDLLTKLPNRALFIDRLEHTIEYSKRHKDYKFSVFYIDIDHFKNVNDSMGHAIGDELLVLFAERMLKHMRKSDTLARLGGDEFAVLLENNSAKKTSIMIAERIQESLRPPYILGGANFYISASIGIVDDTKKYDNPNNILQDADIAMYRAKALGKARYVIFTSNLRTEAISRIDLESQLRIAINKHEFLLYYQPIYSLAKKSLVGFEALIRWNHPERGILLPADFLAVAEDSEIIEQIGEWVLFQACSQMKHWHEKYPQCQNLVININISGRQFRHPDFIRQLENIIKNTGFKPEKICLEITETVLIENRNLANDTFKSLRKMGFKIHIDDFGTGYSSLGYLHRYPVDSIKIDKSFIKSMGKEEKGDQLVQTMITMAKNMGMEVIAEGIETRKQLQDLRSMDCEFGQGYYLSYPLPTAEIDQIIQSSEMYPLIINSPTRISNP